MKKMFTASVLAAAVLLVVPASTVLAQRPTSTERPDTTQVREQAQARAAEARTGAEERKAAIQQEVEARKLQVKQDVCERRQAALTKALPRLAQGATSTKTAFDGVYERVAGFYASGQLTVSNYDELAAKVDAAKANAEAAIETLQGYSFELDCENPNVGQQLDAYRTAVADARDEIKAYRAALTELISAMRAAAADANATEAGADTTSEESQASQEGDSNEQ